MSLGLKNFLKSYHLKMKNEFLPPDALPSVSKLFRASSILLADCSVQKIPETQIEETDPLLLPIYKQRELLVKKAFIKNMASYAQAGLEILISKPQDFVQIAAAYGRLGVSLLKPTESDIAYDYAAYLLARTEILGGNFKLGLSWMPVQLDGLVAIESARVSALAKSQIGAAEQASIEFELLKNQATRLADRLRFGDMAERAREINAGQLFLLGVYVKLPINADLSRF